MSDVFMKLVYTWDYRMRWAPIKRPVERGTGGRPYPYDTRTFLEDYTRAFAWLSRHGYDGVVIWGLFRDNHGGIPAVQELCHRADEHGIRVIAGVGVNCYGGIYWEGNSQYNLENWVRRNPELAAIDQDGKPVIKEFSDSGGSLLCPSRPENLAWYKEGLCWLVEEVGVQGLFYETGDYGMCTCSACAQKPGYVAPYSYASMGDVLPVLMEHTHAKYPDLMQVTISYGTIPHYRRLGLRLAEGLPPYVWCSWMCEGGIGWASTEQDPWRTVVREPIPDFQAVTGRDIAFLSYNSFAAFDEGLMATERIHTMARLCHERGLRGMMQMGELSAVSNLVNYLAMPYFLQHPRSSLTEFLGHVLPKIRAQLSRDRQLRESRKL